MGFERCHCLVIDPERVLHELFISDLCRKVSTHHRIDHGLSILVKLVRRDNIHVDDVLDVLHVVDGPVLVLVQVVVVV